MLEYNKIAQYVKEMGIRDDLSGSFLASVFSHNISQYYTGVVRIVMTGYLYKNGISLADGVPQSMPNSQYLLADLKRIGNQTNIILSTVFRRIEFSKMQSIVETCVELLFNVGYEYDGSSLSGLETTQESISTEKPISDLNLDSDVPDEIADFLRGIIEDSNV